MKCCRWLLVSGLLLVSVLSWGMTPDEAHQYLGRLGLDKSTTSYVGLNAGWNDPLMIEAFLTVGRDINETNSAGQTSLMVSIINNSSTVFNYILTKNPDLNIQDTTGQTALMYACRGYGRSMGFNQPLIDRGADVKLQDKFGRTALQMLCNRYDSDSSDIEAIIAKGANVNQADNEGTTPLMAAVRRANPDIMKPLLSHGVNINQLDSWGESALVYAAQNYLNFKYLIDNGADIYVKSTSQKNILMLLASRQDYDTLQKVDLLVQKGFPLNDRNNDGKTALILAAEYGNTPVVQYLLYKDAVVDLIDNYGYSALMYAAKNRQAEVAHALLQNKAKINLQDKDGETALIKAARCTKYSSYGATDPAEIDRNNRENNQNNKKRMDTFKLLLQYHADFQIKNTKGETALKAALFTGNTDFVQLLWEAGAKE